VWASHENLMTLIEPGYSSEKIIRSGKAMFDRGFKNWFVVYIESQRLAGKPLAEREKLLSLLELARKLGAKIIALNGDNPSEVLLNFARENNINTLMLSQYRISLYYRLFGSSLVDKISELAPEINLQLINDEFTPAKTKLTLDIEAKPKLNWHKIIKASLINLVIFFSLGFVLLPLSRFIANENIIMVYFLFIILTNRHRGLVSATIAALVATISFDFFFIAPRFSFAVSDLQYLLTFAIMAGVGTLFNLVNGNLRYQAQKQHKLHQQIRQLYEFSRKLSEALVYQQVFDALDEFFPQLFKAKYALLTPSLAEELAVNHNQLGERLDLTIARWVFDKGQPAGLNTNTFAASQVYYVALNSQLRTRGVLALIPEAPLDFFLPSEQELLNNFIANIATTLERIHFTQIAIQTEVLLAKKID
jgi:two-component system sensor histidine kinase KdpD